MRLNETIPAHEHRKREPLARCAVARCGILRKVDADRGLVNSALAIFRAKMIHKQSLSPYYNNGKSFSASLRSAKNRGKCQSTSLRSKNIARKFPFALKNHKVALKLWSGVDVSLWSGVDVSLWSGVDVSLDNT